MNRSAEPGPAPAPPLGSAKDEYLDASSNARQFLVLRFAELTIFMTATGAIMAVAFSKIAAPSVPEAALALKLAGLVVAGVFWVMEGRTMAYWRHFVRRAAELERQLGFSQYSSRPPETFLSSHTAIRALIGSAALFWLLSILVVPAPV